MPLTRMWVVFSIACGQITLTTCRYSIPLLALSKQTTLGRNSYPFYLLNVLCVLMNSTGKRTTAGALDDALNSAIRYVNNNFYDGYFEDCLNLTFNKVNISEESDKLVVKMNRFSFVCSRNILSLVLID